MQIRAAHPNDAGGICTVWNPYIAESAVTFTTDEKTVIGIAADIRDRDGAFFVLEEDSQILGFATYFQFRRGPGYMYTSEHTILLAPEAQKQGAGRALMETLEAHAREAGMHSLIGGISAENPGGVSFHAAIGFTEIARLPEVGFKFDRWMDLVLMQKILGGSS
ncbi:GNAT family N-acetyltransferase [Litorisediminicola beolgyonensis]|uniref:GNAT family N-acetyltransferase n=1 Tax=Litorisediminicola beolgyonensis TaxID=1173614 RepID=A0ABW3ZFC6_9RHOB